MLSKESPAGLSSLADFKSKGVLPCSSSGHLLSPGWQHSPVSTAPANNSSYRFGRLAAPHCSPALHTARLSSLLSFFYLKLLANTLGKWGCKEETGV